MNKTGDLERNQNDDFEQQKEFFLGSDNKLKYVLSSLGKEKKDKIYTFWRF